METLTQQIKTLPARQVQERISGADLVTLKKGVYKAFLGYFYRHGQTAEGLAAKVREAFPQAQILETGDAWKPFKGGASLTQQSHFWVTFTL
jgi:hypothetical protein